MMMSDLKIVEATPELIHAYYGQPVPHTIRGYVALLNDHPVGVGGIEYVDGVPIAFSEMRPELRARRRDCARCYRVLEQMLRSFGGVLYAVACEPSSDALLKRIGFKAIGGAFTLGRAVGPLMARA